MKNDDLYAVPANIDEELSAEISESVTAQTQPKESKGLLDSLEKHEVTFQAKVLLNSLKSNAPLYRAALTEHNEPDAQVRARNLATTLNTLVKKVLEASGYEAMDPSIRWLHASLSASLADLVATDWVDNQKCDADRLFVIAKELSETDATVDRSIYSERSAHVALEFSRVAALGHALNKITSRFSAMQARAQDIIDGIDDITKGLHQHIVKALPDLTESDSLIIWQALYREVGNTVASSGSQWAGLQVFKLQNMDRKGRGAYLAEHGGSVPIAPAIEEARKTMGVLMDDLLSGLSNRLSNDVQGQPGL